MKKLIYSIEGFTSFFNVLTEEEEQKTVIAQITIDNPTEEQIRSAIEVAYNGEYSIIDDGQEEPQTTEQRVNELETALTLLLEGATE